MPPPEPSTSRPAADDPLAVFQDPVVDFTAGVCLAQGAEAVS